MGIGFMKTHGKIFVVIPVFNNLSLTKKCLGSFASQKYKDFEVIVVDSHSSDQTVPYIRKRYPNYEIVNGESSWWWTKSMYVGVQKALESAKENDFILTMNNDCYFLKTIFPILLLLPIKKRARSSGL